MVMVEAMSMGKPVIATETQAPSDFVIDGETGLLVPPNDPVSMRNAILSFIQNPEMVREMGLQARRRVEENYSLARFYDRIDALCGGLR
jgi:glycosyltransferase involved in cell wall biosynthesis